MLLEKLAIGKMDEMRFRLFLTHMETAASRHCALARNNGQKARRSMLTALCYTWEALCTGQDTAAVDLSDWLRLHAKLWANFGILFERLDSSTCCLANCEIGNENTRETLYKMHFFHLLKK